MNKKGTEASEMVLYFPRIIFMLIAVFIIVLLVSMFTNINLETQKAESEILFYKIFYSMGSITYTDSVTGRSYSNIVDLERFNSKVIDSALQSPQEKYGSAKLELYDVSGKKVIQDIYYNEVWYKRWLPLSKSLIRGSGSAVEYLKKVPVTYKEGEEFKAGLLKISIILPNTK